MIPVEPAFLDGLHVDRSTPGPASPNFFSDVVRFLLGTARVTTVRLGEEVRLALEQHEPTDCSLRSPIGPGPPESDTTHSKAHVRPDSLPRKA